MRKEFKTSKTQYNKVLISNYFVEIIPMFDKDEEGSGYFINVTTIDGKECHEIKGKMMTNVDINLGDNRASFRGINDDIIAINMYGNIHMNLDTIDVAIVVDTM